MTSARTSALLACSLSMLGCASTDSARPSNDDAPAPAQPTARAAGPVAAPQARRLTPFLGDWTIEATLWPAPGAEPTTLTGEATFAPALAGAYVRERFRLDLGGGEAFTGSTYLGYSRARARYELTQVDDGNDGTIWMTGRYEADGDTLTLEPAEPGQTTGVPYRDLRWSYRFTPDGALLKRIDVQGESGSWWTQSEYRYERAGG